MRTKDGDTIHQILRTRLGAEDAISAPGICRLLRWHISRERLVRQIIADEACLWSDVIVCAVPGRGYFSATRYDELEKYHNWLADIAVTAAEKLRAFRRAAKSQGFTLSTLPAPELAAA